MSKLNILENWAVKLGSSKSGFYGHAGRPGKRGGSTHRGSAGLPSINEESLRIVKQDLEKLATYMPMMMSEFENMSSDEILATARSNLDSYVSDNPVSINVPASVAEAILSDGRFKNQYEVGENPEIFDGKRNQDVERNSWDIQGSDPSAFPIYGYINDGQQSYGGQLNATWYGRANQYGNVEFVLKDSIKDRSTCTVTDSLELFRNRDAVGTPMRDIGIESIPSNWLKEVALGSWDKISYVEAQIHGSVGISDIDRIIVHGGDKMASLDLLASSAGVEVIYSD